MMGDKLGIAELDGERDSELIHDLLDSSRRSRPT